MKIQFKSFLLILLAVSLVPVGSLLAMVDESTARTVANNWIQSVINYKDSWGGSPDAQVAEVTEFKRSDRVLGYYYEVKPSGYIIISLVEGLAPVKAFSTTSRLDPDSDEGMADLLKLKMEGALNIIEARIGPIRSASRAALTTISELDRFDTWDILKAGPVTSSEKHVSASNGGNYQQSEILLTSRWHQGDPYYLQCPSPGTGATCTAPHCAVGCVATAAAQIMRYWCWPPGRDWLNMPDEMNVDPTAEEIAAVSELSHAIGVSVSMKYCKEGGCASAIPTVNMIPVYEGWGFGSPVDRYRADYSFNEWWNLMVGNINSNRPIQYRIVGHSIVCDGWWIYPDPMVHMIYGWSNSYDTWYHPDNLYQVSEDGTTEDEYMLINIQPFTSVIDATFSGIWPAETYWSPRYVGYDCAGDSAVFEAGCLIQFHNRKVMTCNSGWVNFLGLPAENTHVYCGDQSRGVRINNGYILMYPKGSVKFGLSRLD
jgi:peptidase C10-like protein